MSATPTANAAVATTEPATSEQEIKSRIETLQSNLKNFMDSQKTVLKEMVSTLGQIEKLFNKASKTKKSRRRKSAPQKFQLESKTVKSLSKLGLEGDTFTRAELMQGISGYIRNMKLQNPDKKTVWVADTTISKVLDVSKGSENTYLSINQLITPIVKASTKVATESS